MGEEAEIVLSGIAESEGVDPFAEELNHPVTDLGRIPGIMESGSEIGGDSESDNYSSC